MLVDDETWTFDKSWWDDRWGSIHEAGHAVVARHFGLTIECVTMQFVRIPPLRYRAADDRNSRECLIVSAAGDAATTLLLRWTDTDRADKERSRRRLQALGADAITAAYLMTQARRDAEQLVQILDREIITVASALRERRRLSMDEIDAAIAGSWRAVAAGTS